jgi:hypothetical protein
MIRSNNLLKSSKKEGRHETVIINKLIPYFEKLGYDAVPHARFNIAWGNIISDVDLLLIKNDQLILVEVKSSKDDIRRAKKQIANVEDYVDYIYIATDYYPRKFPFEKAGLLVVNGKIEVLKEPELLIRQPKLVSVEGLQKKCLKRMCEVNGKKYANKYAKNFLARELIDELNPEFRYEIKEVLTCGQQCDNACPIWKFDRA